MRLGAFFGKPARAASPAGTGDDISVGVASRRSSLGSVDMTRPLEVKAPMSKPRTEMYFLPFEPFSHSVVAPANRCLRPIPSTEPATDLLQQSADLVVPTKSLFRPRRVQIRRTVPIKDLIAQSNGSVDSPIDLTSETSSALSAIRQAPFKTLEFKEDIRPSYQGTFTRAVSPRTSRKLSRVPTYRGLPDIDYDYDSEAEWEEPEPEDENLDDPDNESEEDDGADDMDDFLDDENDVKRAIATSNEPISTGLCWMGDTELVIDKVNLDEYRFQVMHDDQRLPIDPYSNSHWSNPPKQEKKAAAVLTSAASMQPPRLPLSDVSVNTISPFKTLMAPKNDSAKPKQSEASPVAAAQSPNAAAKARPAKAAKPVKMIPDDLLSAFKAEVQGSDLTKIAIVESLKKKFPSCSKDAIKGTLETVAIREGVKEADKRWVLR